MDCDDLAEVAAELALGVLTGRERAQAIMHLDGCGACREHIRRLALTEEDLLPPGMMGRAAGTPGTWPGAGAQSMLPDADAVTAAAAPALTRPGR